MNSVQFFTWPKLKTSKALLGLATYLPAQERGTYYQEFIAHKEELRKAYFPDFDNLFRPPASEERHNQPEGFTRVQRNLMTAIFTVAFEVTQART